MTNWTNFYQQGLIKEYEFAKLLLNYGGKIEHSSKSVDIHDHVDLIWTLEDKKITFDVKSLKKHNRNDVVFDDSIHWIELQNVNGKKGWLYGKAKYIAFETNTSWIIVSRVKLINWIDNKIVDKTISNSKELYRLYRRSGRLDIIIKILTDDLKEIGKTLIK